MAGGLKYLTGGIAVGLAGIAALATTASAADLGGNCCADLEERIAELEATTAQKGNRKVSLTVSGWVSSQLYWFDDGAESNVYVVDNNNDLSSNVKFTGTAEIVPGWKAGYSLWLYTNAPSSLNTNDQSSGGASGLSVENSYWFVESDKYGKVSVGKQSLAADNAAISTDFSGTLFPFNGVTFDGGFMRLVPKGSNVHTNDPGSPVNITSGNALPNTWQALAFWCESVGLGIGQDCQGIRNNGIRYDSPTFAGFSGSASWGEDDYWDVAARYNGEWSGFKVSFAAAYAESTDSGMGVLRPTNDNQMFQAGAMIKHLASGLWVHGTYNQVTFDDVGEGFNRPGAPEGDGFYVKAGLTQKYTSLGATHFVAEYGRNSDMFDVTTQINGVLVDSTEADRYGAGIVQDIDAASMTLWAKYRRHELDVKLVDGTSPKFEEVDMFLAGAVIMY